MKEVVDLVALVFKVIFFFGLLFSLTGCGLVDNIKYEIGEKDLVEDLNSISNNLVPSSIKIEVSLVAEGKPNVKNISQGSGFIVSSNNYNYKAISNAHVFTGEGLVVKSIKIFDYKGKEYTGKIEKIDEYNDIALIYFTGTNEYILPEVDIATELPKEGEVVYAIGCPNGQFNSVTVGRCLGFSKDIEGLLFDFEVIITDAPIDHGSSGGMLLNDDLEVIGINTLGLLQGDEQISGSIPFIVISLIMQ